MTDRQQPIATVTPIRPSSRQQSAPALAEVAATLHKAATVADAFDAFRQLSSVIDLPIEKLLSRSATDAIAAATVAFADLDRETRERVELAFLRRLRGLSDSVDANVPPHPDADVPSQMAQLAVCSHVVRLLALVRADEEPEPG